MARKHEARFPHVRAQFTRLFGKRERMVGRQDAMRVLVEGDYLAAGDATAARQRPSAALISRLITARVAGCQETTEPSP